MIEIWQLLARLPNRSLVRGESGPCVGRVRERLRSVMKSIGHSKSPGQSAKSCLRALNPRFVPCLLSFRDLPPLYFNLEVHQTVSVSPRSSAVSSPLSFTTRIGRSFALRIHTSGRSKNIFSEISTQLSFPLIHILFDLDSATLPYDPIPMMPFRADEMTACERCGAYIPKVLASFHKCRGSDLHLRPANVSLEQWVRRPMVPAATPPRKKKSPPKENSDFDEIKIPFAKHSLEAVANWAVLSYYNQPDHEDINRQDREVKEVLLRLCRASTEVAIGPTRRASAWPSVVVCMGADAENWASQRDDLRRAFGMV